MPCAASMHNKPSAVLSITEQRAVSEACCGAFLQIASVVLSTVCVCIDIGM